MIKKILDLKKIHLSEQKLFLFYGANEGSKNEKILDILSEVDKEKIYRHDEKEILDNLLNFFEKIISKSLFEDNKIILINRATDKICKVIEDILSKEIGDIKIILNSGVLEKKSKLRTLFEKNNNCICVAFYPDNLQSLYYYAENSLKKNNISISPSFINFIVDKCNGDRGQLLNELNKIISYCKYKKKLTSDVLIKLVNLSENHSVTELIDSCLIKNKKKTVKILNENNFNNDDNILITRSFLYKLKKILKLSIELEKNKNIELTISSAKPPIFWKDKDVIKQQLKIWNSYKIKKLIYKFNEIELELKKNINTSVFFILDAILELASMETNN